MNEFTVGEVHEAITTTRPNQECLVFRDRRLTWNDVNERTHRLADYLRGAGLGCRTERAKLPTHESGQDHLAIYLHNGNEYLECMLASFKSRVAPFNVNYRYVAEELTYLLRDSGATAIAFHSTFAPILQSVLDDVPDLRVLLQVPAAAATCFPEQCGTRTPLRPEIRRPISIPHPTISTSCTPVEPPACPKA